MQDGSDISVYTSSHLSYAIDNNLLNTPNPDKTGNSNEIFSYVFWQVMPLD